MFDQKQQQRPLAYSVSEVCQLTSLSRSRLYQLFAEGKLARRKVGNRTLVLAAELDRFLADLPLDGKSNADSDRQAPTGRR